MTVIVCGCWHNGLNIIQTLGRHDVNAYAVDTFRNVGTLSRYADYHNVPDPQSNEEGAVQELKKLVDSCDDEPVIIPTGDEWALLLAKHRDTLSGSAKLCVASERVVELLLNKDQFGSWAEERDYSVPQTFEPHELEEVPSEAYPIAAKPKDPKDETVDFRLEVMHDESEARQFVDENESILEAIVFQEYVRGMSDSMFTVGVYADEGTILGLFTGRKVRGYPPDVGDCKVGQVESVPDDLVTTAENLCEELGYTGIAEFEYKRDAESGDYYLIEVNPRSWSWVGITPDCGVNLPRLAYSDLHATLEVENEDPPLHTRALEDGAVKWVKISEDLPNSLLFYYFNHREWHMGPVEWWRSLQCESLVTADIAKDDPLPTLAAPALFAVRYGLKAKRKLGGWLS